MTTPIVSLLAMQGFREVMRKQALNHPRLIDPSSVGRENVATWEATILKSETLKPVSIRLPESLVERVNAFAGAVESRSVVSKCTKTDAMRVLLELSLDLMDKLDDDGIVDWHPDTVRELVTMSLEAVQNVRTEPVA